jgi:uncharacterized cupin superfamily protein
MPKIDIDAAAVRRGSSYAPPLNLPMEGLARWKLGAAGGLTDFGVNLARIPPGAWTSQRHWHSHEDEFVYVLEGEVVLVDETGEHILRHGDAAAFPAGDPNGHHLQNRTDGEAVVLEVGSRRRDMDVCAYPDTGQAWGPGGPTDYPGKP